MRSVSSEIAERKARSAFEAGISKSTSRCCTSRHAGALVSTQSTRTGRRLAVPGPDRNGSGNEPTTAGTRWAPSQARRSHQIRSPARTFVVAAPFGASLPLTK